jgi:hypothetical protein
MLAASVFMIVFRFVHIVSGVLWVGSAFLFVAVIGPSAAEVGPAAGPLLTVAVKKRKVVKIITGLGGTTVLAGWIMWLHDMGAYGGFHDWTTSTFGIGITIGAIFATIAAFEGAVMVGGNVERLVDLGQEAGAGGGPPTPELQQKMAEVQAHLQTHGKLDLVLLLIAVTCMATARYW